MSCKSAFQSRALMQCARFKPVVMIQTSSNAVSHSSLNKPLGAHRVEDSLKLCWCQLSVELQPVVCNQTNSTGTSRHNLRIWIANRIESQPLSSICTEHVEMHFAVNTIFFDGHTRQLHSIIGRMANYVQ